MNHSHTRIVRCKDGSDTLYSEQFGQHYHNPNGAYEESVYVFFEQSGLINRIQAGKGGKVLEIGFGTGLNLLLLADYLKTYENTEEWVFRSMEAYPIDAVQFRQMNYGAFLKHSELIDDVAAVFSTLKEGMNHFELLPTLRLELFVGFFDQMELPEKQYEVILQDAFSPEVNAELWQPAHFERLFHSATNNAVMTTYGAASSARAAMAMGGWKLARARGALGKREMTIASKSDQFFEKRGLKRVNEARLIERWKAGEWAS